jgi:hypothetical protein
VVHEDGRHQRAPHIISFAGIAPWACLIRFPHGDNPSFLNAKAWSRMYNQKGFAGSPGFAGLVLFLPRLQRFCGAIAALRFCFHCSYPS